jgi:hypothetical protein
MRRQEFPRQSINTTIKGVLRRARGMRDDAMLLLKLKSGERAPDPIISGSRSFLRSHAVH